MVKYISCGKCNNKYKFLFFSILFLLIYRFSFGFSFDGEEKYKLMLPKNSNFSEHFLIHQIFIYLSCIILSCIFFIKEKKEHNPEEGINLLDSPNEIKYKGSFVDDLTLIYKENYEKDRHKKSNSKIILTILLYVFLEQTELIFIKCFIHMDFWMLELYILAFLNLILFKIKIYKHQKLAFVVNSISVLLQVIVIILTLIEGNKSKSLYANYWYFTIIGLIIYFIYASLISYTFIKIKQLIDLKFVSINLILFVYGFLGLVFCCCECIILTFIYCENDNYNYLFRIKYDDKNYIDNFMAYSNSLKNETNSSDVKIEVINIFIGGAFFSGYKFYVLKIIETLTPLHKIFSYPIYYFVQKFIILLFKGHDIFKDGNDNIYMKYKLIIDLFSDLMSIIGFLIYIEIIELNFCDFNYNLRKNIILRGDKDTFKIFPNNKHIDNDDKTNSEFDESILNSSSSEIYD